ncbi:MAG: nucleotidyltransferase family protein [Hyphomicrobium aestuarii]|mgnify:CR=1 FL=1|nr:nucleotidyltransferase family protein [Hyphomicrobium aestuarii]
MTQPAKHTADGSGAARDWRPHAAFVLAAGLGTRMRHLTATIPKPMVALNGVTLIDRVLDRIADAGITTAIVNVHYRADELEAHLGRREGRAPHIVISDERAKLLDTGGGVIHAWPQLSAGPFLIHNSDSVWIEGVGRNLDRLSLAFDADRMDAILLLAPTANSLGYDGNGDFQMDGAGCLSRREHGQEAAFVFAGASIAHPRLFDGAPDGPFSLNHVWNRAIEAGRLYGVRLDGTWMHVGTPEAVVEAERQLDREDAP